jgi:hypothetical protein
MIKSLAAFIAAFTLTVPAVATVDPGTTRLLQTIQEYGVTIEYNPSHCSKGYQGRYTTAKVMSLCYRGAPTASDHDTVRHEAFHFLQHCASLRRGDLGITPLAISTTKRNQWVSQVLHSGTIRDIKTTYPVRNHQVELEAFAAARHYNADQLATLITRWCIK